MNDPCGSKWRKWDLHVHTPGTKLSDGYKVNGSQNVWDEFCKRIEESDVKVFGITDYFSTDGYKTSIKEHQNRYPESEKKFFLNIELKLNESVNNKLEEINLHLIFSPLSSEKADDFLSNLKLVKTGKDEISINCSELNTRDEYESATVTRESIELAFKETFGKKAIRQDYFLIFTAANNEGIRPEKGKKRKEIISDEVDKFSDAFFGGVQNTEYFLKVDRLEDKEQLVGKKPVVAGGDAHSFQDLDNFLGKRAIDTNDNGMEIIIKDVTWIKADPSFEGLKQIIYEPDPGERVCIGPMEPDSKNKFQIIRKIKFNNTSDFPDEVNFNNNLCSVIGSRSTGKSALLAYIAHSIDKDLVESLTNGPGEGEDYHWDKINIDYSVEWDNGASTDDTQGRVIYIRQNYLIEKSKDSEEIKKKIEPVLFNKFPDFKLRYEQTKTQIDNCNTCISTQIDSWIELSDSIVSLKEDLEGLGNKEGIKKEKENTESKIEDLKIKYQLSEDDVKTYKEVTANLSMHVTKIDEKKKELAQIVVKQETGYYFTSLNWNFIPDIKNLPQKLQDEIKTEIKNASDAILDQANKKIIEYRTNLDEKIKVSEEAIVTIRKENNDLLEKYQKNIELSALIEKIDGFNKNLETVGSLEKTIATKEISLGKYQKDIDVKIKERENALKQLKEYLDTKDQKGADIEFNIEYGLNVVDIDKVAKKINLKEKTKFVEKNELKIKFVKFNSAEFLKAIYSGGQKINIGNTKEDVLKEMLTLTENILFAAKMEGDRIGGFSETTMTPGRRALFLLKLILNESDDAWPILIDQPEDNLDSRSIANEIVPFFKKKKKERQIIMASHNANLVVGADSEQIIVANRHGQDKPNMNGKQFNYLTGSIENTKDKSKDIKDTLEAQGIREHTCDILDGGREAFEYRRNKYNLRKWY